MKPFLIAISFLFLLSCSAKKEYFKVQKSSVFANVNELGVNKASFISKYGEPINKDLKKEGNDIVESLYYLEDIQGVMVTTKMKFVNDNLVEQSNYKMDVTDNRMDVSDKKVRDLQRQMRTTKMEIFRNEMNK